MICNIFTIHFRYTHPWLMPAVSFTDVSAGIVCTGCKCQNINSYIIIFSTTALTTADFAWCIYHMTESHLYVVCLSIFKTALTVSKIKKLMVNGSRYYTALESVSIASAFFTALTIYPCQIRVHQHWQSKRQLPTARKKEWRPATADSSPQAVTCQHCDTHYFNRPRTHNLPI